MKIWYFWGLEELKFVILEIPKCENFAFWGVQRKKIVILISISRSIINE